MPTEEIITPGIVIMTEDYKEADRLLRVLTPEFGFITAKATGVRKAKAKLKYAAVPFALCEYSLLKRGSFYTLKNASQIESLMGVADSPEKYLSASVVLECAGIAGAEGNSPGIFIRLLKALKRIIYSDVDPFSIAVNFVFSLLVKGGYVRPEKQDERYFVDIDDQEDLGEDGVGRAVLLKMTKQFEGHFSCRLRAAELL